MDPNYYSSVFPSDSSKDYVVMFKLPYVYPVLVYWLVLVKIRHLNFKYLNP